MVASSKINNTKYQVKSISLPCRSHPSTLRIEEELNKIKASLSSPSTKPCAENICNGLSQLAELYQCMDELLQSSATQDLISCHRDEKWVNEIIDGSMKFLDVCGTTRDVVLKMKEEVRDLRSALRRRRRGDSSIESSIVKYNCYRRKMRKDVKGLVASLKQGENMIDVGCLVANSDHHHHQAAVVRVLLEVSEMTVSIFEFVLRFLAMPAKTSKWSVVVSKLINKGTVACEDQENELDNFDVTLCNACIKDGASAQAKLEKMEAEIERIESGLECMFRTLIRTRVSLLNIISP